MNIILIVFFLFFSSSIFAPPLKISDKEYEQIKRDYFDLSKDSVLFCSTRKWLRVEVGKNQLYFKCLGETFRPTNLTGIDLYLATAVLLNFKREITDKESDILSTLKKLGSRPLGMLKDGHFTTEITADALFYLTARHMEHMTQTHKYEEVCQDAL
jgi:hypothetical protein